MMTQHEPLRLLKFTPRRRRAPRKDSRQIEIMRELERVYPEHLNVLTRLAVQAIASAKAEAEYDDGGAA